MAKVIMVWKVPYDCPSDKEKLGHKDYVQKNIKEFVVLRINTLIGTYIRRNIVIFDSLWISKLVFAILSTQNYMGH